MEKVPINLFYSSCFTNSRKSCLLRRFLANGRKILYSNPQSCAHSISLIIYDVLDRKSGYLVEKLENEVYGSKIVLLDRKLENWMSKLEVLHSSVKKFATRERCSSPPPPAALYI